MTVGVQKSAGKIHSLSDKQVVGTMEDLFTLLKGHHLSEKDIKSHSITLCVHIWDRPEVRKYVIIKDLFCF